MFDLLKKKLSSFVSSISSKKQELPPEEKTPEALVQPEKEAIPAPIAPQVEVREEPEPLPQPEVEKRIEEVLPEKPVEVTKPTLAELPKPKPVEQPKPVQAPKPIELPKFVQPPKPIEVPAPRKEEQRALAPKLGIFTKLKGVFAGEVAVSEAETKDLFDELEMALLESDVSFDTAQFLVADLKKRIVGRKFPKDKIGEAVKGEIASTLQSILSAAPRVDLMERVEKARAEGRPFVILFVGPNGAGKTTTIAKIASRLKDKGISSVISASDTFRAAAVEQAIHHGEKLGIRVVRQTYGADPAAVAFDAISHAKANKLDVVLVDTAGRQETNVNLVKEMEKINRVVKPDLKVFVGEAIAGNALVEQVKEFSKAIGIDALVLTKLDCDAKGGNSLSIAFETKLPVLFVGMGQEYKDLIPFDAQFIVGKILAA